MIPGIGVIGPFSPVDIDALDLVQSGNEALGKALSELGFGRELTDTVGELLGAIESFSDLPYTAFETGLREGYNLIRDGLVAAGISPEDLDVIEGVFETALDVLQDFGEWLGDQLDDMWDAILNWVKSLFGASSN